VLDFEPVVWGPKLSEIHQLPLLPGDTVGGASGINDRRQVIGVEGICSDPGRHGVLWDDGMVIDLGNLGGPYTFPWAINAKGEIVGQSNVTGNTVTHAFAWTKDQGIQDLGLLPGDSSSLAFGVNNRGQVVGGSCDTPNYNRCEAFLWEDGVLMDINRLVCSPTSLHLFFGNDINDEGEIVGFAFDKSRRQFVPFLATPIGRGPAGAKGC